HAKANNSGAIAKMHTSFCDRRCKHGRQVTAVATANDVSPGARCDARLKRQSNDDDQEPPRAPYCGSGSYNSSPNDVKTLTNSGADSPTTIHCFCLNKPRSAVSGFASRPFRLVLANLSRSSRKSLVRVLARLLTLGSGKKL